ncbi:uncharacterized protein CC84DRAFT_1158581 [Paraphaeosphaeria sporulosa]|uniref:Uncharacterized protein n=1 Tax=Paraphaeosphaeria sporulosa TaxID=1460663 RepID=A0A177BVA0_9PLEO|nr:uncharacterized protein CC84DRAFT_1158581 [Paraphaeosphaeria sporulosa]OAF98651.1 hypothetical protein CC84DRAFT_1158581 [Paraphaeosphaeria sporulosa]
MATPTVWANYVPPRGQCNYKPSIMSAKCPCLRFMLHPLKSTSSFECDGCAHHASFHSMENKEEDEIRKRWEQEARDKAHWEQQGGLDRPRKRPREINYGRGDAASSQVRTIEAGIATPDEETASKSGSARVVAKGKGKGLRAKGRITEIPEDDEDYIELD